MREKTLVLRKNGHWYVLNSNKGDEREILLALMEYAEEEHFDIEAGEVYSLMEQLGYRLEVYIPGLGAA